MSYSATILGGFWPTNGVQTLTELSPPSAAVIISRKMAKLREMRETLQHTIGAAAGVAALYQYSRVAAAEELGGVRAIETVTVINRNTTAADIAAGQLVGFYGVGLDAAVGPATVANLDGNPLGTR